MMLWQFSKRLWTNTRWRWFLPLFCWGILPIVMIISPWLTPPPPTAIEQETSVKTIGWLVTLLYVIPGWWLCKQAAHNLDEKSKSFHAVMVVFVSGTLASITVGLLSTNFATVLNARHSEVSTPRSLFVGYYTKRFSGGRNGPFWITYAIIPDREQPNNATTIPRLLDNLTGQQSGYQSGGYLSGYHEGHGLLHLCMNEHRGSLGWLWYDQIGPCTQPPEHFQVWTLKDQRIAKQTFIEQPDDSMSHPSDIPLFTTISGCEINHQDVTSQTSTCTNTVRPTQAENDVVGIDLLALANSSPAIHHEIRCTGRNMEQPVYFSETVHSTVSV